MIINSKKTLIRRFLAFNYCCFVTLFGRDVLYCFTKVTNLECFQHFKASLNVKGLVGFLRHL